jgi:hypothetical protein
VRGLDARTSIGSAVEPGAASGRKPDIHEDYVSAYDLGRLAESARFVRHCPEQNPVLRDPAAGHHHTGSDRGRPPRRPRALRLTVARRTRPVAAVSCRRWPRCSRWHPAAHPRPNDDTSHPALASLSSPSAAGRAPCGNMFSGYTLHGLTAADTARPHCHRNGRAHRGRPSTDLANTDGCRAALLSKQPLPASATRQA